VNEIQKNERITRHALEQKNIKKTSERKRETEQKSRPSKGEIEIERETETEGWIGWVEGVDLSRLDYREADWLGDRTRK
jgi:hypothetical protein